MRGGYARTAAGRHPPGGVCSQPMKEAGGGQGSALVSADGVQQGWPLLNPCVSAVHTGTQGLRTLGITGAGPVPWEDWTRQGHGRSWRGHHKPLQRVSGSWPAHHTGHGSEGPCRGVQGGCLGCEPPRVSTHPGHPGAAGGSRGSRGQAAENPGSQGRPPGQGEEGMPLGGQWSWSGEWLGAGVCHRVPGEFVKGEDPEEGGEDQQENGPHDQARSSTVRPVCLIRSATADRVSASQTLPDKRLATASRTAESDS